MGQGMVHETRLSASDNLALAGVARANDQQAQQACVNGAICLLAVRSASARRQSDLQGNHTSIAALERHISMVRGNEVDAVVQI
jgi:hypothetical protein